MVAGAVLADAAVAGAAVTGAVSDTGTTEAVAVTTMGTGAGGAFGAVSVNSGGPETLIP